MPTRKDGRAPAPPARRAVDPTLTELLLRFRSQADSEVRDEIFVLTYDELKRLARQKLRGEGARRPLCTTDLVHHVWEKISALAAPSFPNRRAYYGFAAYAMRHILVDFARQAQAAKRHAWGGAIVVSAGPQGDKELERMFGRGPGKAGSFPEQLMQPPPNVDVLIFQEVIEQLERVAPRAARLLEQRMLTNLTLPEIAEINGIALATVKRQLSVAVLWVRRRLGEDDDPGAAGRARPGKAGARWS